MYSDPRDAHRPDGDQPDVKPVDVASDQQGLRRSSIAASPKIDPPPLPPLPRKMRDGFGTPPPKRLVEGDYQPVPTPSPPSTVSRIYRYYEDRDSMPYDSGISDPAPELEVAPPPRIQSFGTLQESPSSISLHTLESSHHSPHSLGDDAFGGRAVCPGPEKEAVETKQAFENKKESTTATVVGSNAEVESSGSPSKTLSSRVSSVAALRHKRKITQGDSNRPSQDPKPTKKEEHPTTDGASTIGERKEQERPSTPRREAVVPSIHGNNVTETIDWSKRHVWARAVVLREDVEREQVMRRRAEMGWD
jgi:hypothetical protein